MRNLLAKELKLSIHPFFYVVPFLTGSLFLIPKWIFFVALMYFFFISVPNICSTYNAQNDMGFTIMMPVRKKDIVRSRIAAFAVLELLHLATGGLFAWLNHIIYHQPNFAMNTNMAFFGAAFIMFGIFNLTFFPIYFKTGWKFGMATIAGTVVTVVFATAVEFSLVAFPALSAVLQGAGSADRLTQAGVLAAGILLFAAATGLSSSIAARRFETADL